MQGLAVPPVIIDLDGDSDFHSDTLRFKFMDVDGDGFRNVVRNIDEDDGVLILDQDLDGIYEPHEINFAVYDPDARSDMRGLAEQFDTNLDGELSAADESWNEFRVWVDADNDGTVQNAELHSAATLGLVSIGLEPDGAGSALGNGILGTTWAQFSNGSAKRAADAVLSYSDFGIRTTTTAVGVGIEFSSSPAMWRFTDNLSRTVDVNQLGYTIVEAGAGNDTLNAAGDGAVTLGGGAGDDSLVAGNGDDWLFGGSGADQLSGGGGDDWLFADDLDDLSEVSGGAGIDVFLMLSGAGSVIEASELQVEAVIGGGGDDTISGGDLQGFRASGGHGDDSIASAGFNDFLFGDDGDDSLIAGAGKDTLTGELGNDTLNGGHGGDLYYYARGDGHDLIHDFWEYETSTTVYDPVTVIEDVWTHTGTYGPDGTDIYAWIPTSVLTYVPRVVVDTVEGDGGVDTLEFGFGIALTDLLLARDGDNLEAGLFDEDDASLGLAALADRVTIQDWGDSRNRIEVLRFDDGTEVDISQLGFLTGAVADDTLVATGRAWLSGHAGDDSLTGSTGADVLMGGAGADTLAGGAGNDLIFFGRGDGHDTIHDDYRYDQPVSWYINTGTITYAYLAPIDGNLIYTEAYAAGPPSNTYYDNGLTWYYGDLQTGTEEVHANAGSDTLDFGAGIAMADLLFAYEGDDLLVGLAPQDAPDADFATLADRVRIEDWADSRNRIESFRFHGGYEIDVSAATFATGTLEADTLAGGTGRDWINLRAGDDSAAGDAGNDFLFGGAGRDVLAGQDGDDLLSGGEQADSLSGDAGEDMLYGGAGSDTLSGGAADDVIYGGTGLDRIDGGAGADWLQGEGGADTFVLGSLAEAGDVIADFQLTGGDRIDLSGFLASVNWNSSIDPFGNAVLVLRQDGAHAILAYDADGVGAGAAVDVLALLGVTAVDVDTDVHFIHGANTAPVIAAPDAQVAFAKAVNLSSLFTLTDAQGNAPVRYEVRDLGDGATSAHLLLGTVAQAANTVVAVEAADLSTLKVVGGTAAATETFQIRAFDGLAWSDWTDLDVTSFNTAPTVAPTARLFGTGFNQSIQASTLFSAVDAEGHAIVTYRFYDSTDAAYSGHFSLDGVQQAANQNFDVAAEDLDLLYITASAQVNDQLWVQAYDGYAWGEWTDWQMGQTDGSVRALAVSTRMLAGGSVAAIDLVHWSDPGATGSTVYTFQFWDDIGTAGTARFTVDGVTQSAGVNITVAAVDLDDALVHAADQAATSGESVWVRVHDGTSWGAWANPLVRTYDGDTLAGSAGHDRLVGNADANTLSGAAGDDTLYGGGDDDCFVVGQGLDVIADFTDGDLIDLSGVAGLDSFAQVLAAGQQVGADVVFHFGNNNGVTLRGVEKDDLVAADFVI